MFQPYVLCLYFDLQPPPGLGLYSYLIVSWLPLLLYACLPADPSRRAHLYCVTLLLRNLPWLSSTAFRTEPQLLPRGRASVGFSAFGCRPLITLHDLLRA